MFKGFQNKRGQFNGFTSTNFQMNNQAFGFSGCTFWMDAAYGLNTQTNLEKVSFWMDKISGLYYSQSTVASQPRFVQSNASYNGYPTIESNGASQRLINLTQRPVGKTVAYIANYNTIQNVNVVYAPYSTLTSGTTGWSAVGGSATGINGVVVRKQDTSYASGTTESSSVKIVVITPNSIFVNGVQEFSGDTNVDRFVCGMLMGISVNTTDTLFGHLAELIFWSADYSGRQMEISTALNDKYAIY